MEVQLHVFFTLTLDGGEWADSRPARLISSERFSYIRCMGGWLGPSTNWSLLRREELSTIA
jgi:hypothetical protein